MSRILVTGATGVLGRRAVAALLAAGHDVTAVTRRGGTRADVVRQLGAEPIAVDVFDAAAVSLAVAGHDAICHLATHIPTGPAMVRRRAWRTNDRLRSDAATNLSQAAVARGITRYIGESLTFPYVDCGDRWIDESTPRDFFWGNRTTRDAEAAADLVTDNGGVGISLRFGMLHAPDSAHLIAHKRVARLGISPLFGAPDTYISFIDVHDAAAAVVAALTAPPGAYNVAEPAPTTREAHATALADVVGRDQLRFVPERLTRIAGDSIDSLARSQRVDGSALTDATGWRPETRPIERWSAVR